MKKTPGKLFGVSIQYNDDELPPFVIDTINYLEERALNIEGLFRISGDNNIIQEYKDKLDRGKKVNYAEIKDIHVVTGLLKLYFRSLPEPLCTFECYDMFLAATTVPDPDQRMIMIRKVVGFLPPKNYRLLKLLCVFLKKLTDNSEVNKMSPENLAICFAPNLIRSDSTDLQLMLKNQKIGTDAMVSLIKHYDYFFGEDPQRQEVKVKKYDKKDLEKLDPEAERSKQVEEAKQKRSKLMGKSHEVLSNIDMQSIYEDEIKKHDIKEDEKKHIETIKEVKGQGGNKFKTMMDVPKDQSPSPKLSPPTKQFGTSVIQQKGPVSPGKTPPLPPRSGTVIGGAPPQLPPKKSGTVIGEGNVPPELPKKTSLSFEKVETGKLQKKTGTMIIPGYMDNTTPTKMQTTFSSTETDPSTKEKKSIPELPQRRGTVLPPLPTKKEN